MRYRDGEIIALSFDRETFIKPDNIHHGNIYINWDSVVAIWKIKKLKQNNK